MISRNPHERSKGLCRVCGQDKDLVRNIDLYTIGSEGTNCCLDCEKQITQFVRDLSRDNHKIIFEKKKKEILERRKQEEVK